MRRPPVPLVLIVGAVLLAVSVLGIGLLRAATYDPPAPGVAAAHAEAVAGAPGRCAGVPVSATRELRGMWLTTVMNIDWPSRPGLSREQVQAEYRSWLDLAVSMRHNAIFVHVRPSGDAFWPSAYAPWSEWLTGKRDGRSPGWDPMEFMVAEAHARNLEFHAWFNPYRGTQPAPSGPGADFAKLAPNHPLRTHRDWAVAYPDGPRARLYFDPGIPAARAFVEDAMLEAVKRYDVDGVHFDDFFYPYPEGGGNEFDDDASFALRADRSQSRADWRRANVDTLVREMNQRIKQLKPWVKFGISPFGIWRNRETDRAGSDTHGLQSYDAIYADTRTWVRGPVRHCELAHGRPIRGSARRRVPRPTDRRRRPAAARRSRAAAPRRRPAAATTVAARAARARARQRRTTRTTRRARVRCRTGAVPAAISR